MKNFFNTLLNNFFGMLAGTMCLAILLMVMQIFGNFGAHINPKTLSIGWMMVFLWLGIILGMTLFQYRNNQKED